MDKRTDKPLIDGALLPVDEVHSMAPRANKPAPAADGKKAEEAADILREILYRMDIEADVNVRFDNEEEVVLDVDGPDSGRAIGKKGQTLDALQFVLNKVVNRHPDSRRHIVVDSGDYRERHDKRLTEMAEDEAQRAIEEATVVTLRPMSARDRRVIHMCLANYDGVTTQSDGEGMDRRIQIIPKGLSPRPIRRHGRGGGRDGGGPRGESPNRRSLPRDDD